MTLRQKRVLFTKLVAQLLVKINEHDWSPYGIVEVAADEWTVHNPRLYTDYETGERRFGTDRIHNPKGLHPSGLAMDLLVYIDGRYVRDGNHPIWGSLDIMAHELNPDLNFGDEFHDSNHLSLGEVKS